MPPSTEMAQKGMIKLNPNKAHESENIAARILNICPQNFAGQNFLNTLFSQRSILHNQNW